MFSLRIGEIEIVKIFHLNSSTKKHFHDNLVKQNENSFSRIDFFFLVHHALNFFPCNAKQEINLTLPKMCIFFNCYLAILRPTLGHSQGDSLTNPMLITVFFSIST